MCHQAFAGARAEGKASVGIGGARIGVQGGVGAGVGKNEVFDLFDLTTCFFTRSSLQGPCWD
jgi:hypothetical protein